MYQHASGKGDIHYRYSFDCDTVADRMIRTGLTRLRLFPTARIYFASAAGFVLFSLFLIPGNPVWDWSKTRLLNAVLINSTVLLLSSAVFLDRRSLMRRLERTGHKKLAMIFVSTPILLLSTTAVLYNYAPGYLRSVLREFGLAEPFTSFFYILAAITGLEHYRALQKSGQDFRPYKLLAVFYVILFFEENDWLGIFGAFFGRINGAYLGSIHDIGNVWYKSPYKGATGSFIVLTGACVIYALWKKKYIHPAFLKREAAAPSTLLIYSWLILSIIAGIYDIDGSILIEFNIPGFPEEAFEMLGAMLLLFASLLKYIRDIQVQKSGKAEERKGNVRDTGISQK